MWNIIFYERDNGDVPVKVFLDSLPAKHLAKAFYELDILQEHGTSLTLPHARQIEGKLWELRIKFASDISRVFYFIPMGNDIVLLSGFVKKTQKTPAQEIKRAKAYMDDWNRRFGK